MTVIACPIVTVGKTGKHPNADSLSITHVAGNCIIFRTGEFEEGKRAVFIPEEALVPEAVQWAFLWGNRIKENKPVREKDRVVRAKKLRGVFSCGLLVPVPAGHENDLPGTDLVGHFGITKYEPPEQVGSGGDNAPTPGWLPKFTDIENARGFLFGNGQVEKLSPDALQGFNPSEMARSDLLRPGEAVVITEKIHGANARYAYHDGQFIVGSHANVKANDSTNWWTFAAKDLGMEERCKKCPGYILFGEVYGQVQKGYQYGLKKPTLVLFDAYSISERKYVDWDFFAEMARELELSHVPILYKGPWVSLDHAAQFSDGPSVLGKGAHNREGCVIRTNPERRDEYLGRMVLKVIGETYLLSKYADR
jgi:RNA ligase (TIGR02306 family)